MTDILTNSEPIETRVRRVIADWMTLVAFSAFMSSGVLAVVYVLSIATPIPEPAVSAQIVGFGILGSLIVAMAGDAIAPEPREEAGTDA